MDILLSIIVFIVVIAVWVQAGMNGRRSSNGIPSELWKPARANQISVSQGQRVVNREYALQKARPFLKKYTDPMGEHCLANENCKVNLINDDNMFKKKIICINKKQNPQGKIKILTAVLHPENTGLYEYTPDYVIDSLWDTLCMNFSAITVYENIYEALTMAMLSVSESEINVQKGTKTQKVYDSVSNTQIRTNNLLNINTATEAELLSLPGVNIVIAKKALNHIEKTGGFKSVDEFLEKMKIKEIFAEQIRTLACVNFDETAENKPTQENIEQKPSTQQNTGNLDIFEENSGFTPHSDNERIIDL